MRDSAPNLSTDLQREPLQKLEDLVPAVESGGWRIESEYRSSPRQSLYICTQFVARSVGRNKADRP